MCKNLIESDWPPIIRRMRFACRNTNTINTNIHTHTQNMWYCFASPTMLPRTRLKVSLCYVAWLLITVFSDVMLCRLIGRYQGYRRRCSVRAPLITCQITQNRNIEKYYFNKSDVWLTVHRNSVSIRNRLDVTFAIFISPLQVAQHVSGNHVPIFRSWRLRSVIATCWYCAVAAGRLSEPVSS